MEKLHLPQMSVKDFELNDVTRDELTNSIGNLKRHNQSTPSTRGGFKQSLVIRCRFLLVKIITNTQSVMRSSNLKYLSAVLLLNKPIPLDLSAKYSHIVLNMLLFKRQPGVKLKKQFPDHTSRMTRVLSSRGRN